MDHATLRVNEMMRMTYAPQLAQASGPRFVDLTGAPLTVIPCGVPYVLEVPGYAQAYFIVTKDGVEVLRDVIQLPAQYTAVCPQDVAHFVLTAYDTATGSLIGTVAADVVEPSSVPGPTAGGLSKAALLGLGVLGFLMFRRKK